MEVFMNKHTIQLERLCQKFQIRYGVDDALVKQLRDEIARSEQEEERAQQWRLQGFKPHEEHTVAPEVACL